MSLLFLISQLVFGSDVTALGDRDWATRHAAHQRIGAVGWLAYPAVLAGLESDCPERANRCADLLDALPRDLAVFVAAKLMRSDCVLPADDWAGWLLIRRGVAAVARDDEELTITADDGERRTRVDTPNLAEWMRNPPWYGGGPSGEVRVVVQAYRAKHKAGKQ